MSISYDLPPDWPEYLFNVQFTADYFTLTVHVNIPVDDTDKALEAAAELMEEHYGIDAVNIARVDIEIERI